jgi:hypothetical protein
MAVFFMIPSIADKIIAAEALTAQDPCQEVNREGARLSGLSGPGPDAGYEPISRNGLEPYFLPNVGQPEGVEPSTPELVI